MDIKFQRKALGLLLLILTVALALTDPEKPLIIELVQSVLRGVTTGLCTVYLIEEKLWYFQLSCVLALTSSVISAWFLW